VNSHTEPTAGEVATRIAELLSVAMNCIVLARSELDLQSPEGMIFRDLLLHVVDEMDWLDSALTHGLHVDGIVWPDDAEARITRLRRAVQMWKTGPIPAELREATEQGIGGLWSIS
jgi:hypothetical protein